MRKIKFIERVKLSLTVFGLSFNSLHLCCPKCDSLIKKQITHINDNTKYRYELECECGAKGICTEDWSL